MRGLRCASHCLMTRCGAVSLRKSTSSPLQPYHHQANTFSEESKTSTPTIFHTTTKSSTCSERIETRRSKLTTSRFLNQHHHHVQPKHQRRQPMGRSRPRQPPPSSRPAKLQLPVHIQQSLLPTIKLPKPVATRPKPRPRLPLRPSSRPSTQPLSKPTTLLRPGSVPAMVPAEHRAIQPLRPAAATEPVPRRSYSRPGTTRQILDVQRE